MSERRVTDYVKREKAWLALKSEAYGFTVERIFCVLRWWFEYEIECKNKDLDL